MRSLCKRAQCTLSIFAAWYSVADAPAQTPPAGRAVYRCTVAGVTTFSDRPCAPQAVLYEPDSSRISTYNPPLVPPAAALRSQTRTKTPRRSIAEDQVRHAADCERIRDSLKDLAARMRAGYSAKQGEQLRGRKAKLEQQRRARKCR